MEWIQSYVTAYTYTAYTVLTSGSYSEPAVLKYGVPYGSVLGLDFSDYSALVASLSQVTRYISPLLHRCWLSSAQSQKKKDKK